MTRQEHVENELDDKTIITCSKCNMTVHKVCYGLEQYYPGKIYLFININYKENGFLNRIKK